MDFPNFLAIQAPACSQSLATTKDLCWHWELDTVSGHEDPKYYNIIVEIIRAFTIVVLNSYIAIFSTTNT